MMLDNKTAVVYGASGAVGAAVSRAFAREGAHVFLTGRNLEAVNTVAKEIIADGGRAEVAQVDALDEQGVTEHLDAVAEGSRRSISRSTPLGFHNSTHREFHLPNCRSRTSHYR
jgi:NADP-dependent 3-hydroxy acid dehydrogenase YdfG